MLPLGTEFVSPRDLEPLPPSSPFIETLKPLQPLGILALNLQLEIEKLEIRARKLVKFSEELQSTSFEEQFVYPEYYRTVKREGDAWYFRHPRVFCRGVNAPNVEEIEEREERYGLSKAKVVIELFRINAGRQGYYLANLRERKYYYCGPKFEDVKQTLQSLGIGRADPMDAV